MDSRFNDRTSTIIPSIPLKQPILRTDGTYTAGNVYNWPHPGLIEYASPSSIDYMTSNQIMDIAQRLIERTEVKEKENENMFEGMMNGIMGKIAPDMLRMSINGVAVKTANGYKTYNPKTGNLVNAGQFVFDIGQDLFFLIPTNNVKPGDIILVQGGAGGARRPVYVLEATKKEIKAVVFEDGTISSFLPERHIFMGNMYMYGKVFSPFGSHSGGNMKMDKIMKFMLMSQMMGGSTGKSGGFGDMLPMMMLMGGSGGNMFEDMFAGIADEMDFDGMMSDFDIDEDSTEEDE